MDEITQPGRPAPPPPVVPAAPSGAPPGSGKREPRILPAGQGAAWWSEGWQVFMAAPGMWIAVIVVFVLVMVAMAFVPVVGSIAESVLAPVFGGGIALGCHALAKGRPLTTLTKLFRQLLYRFTIRTIHRIMFWSEPCLLGTLLGGKLNNPTGNPHKIRNKSRNDCGVKTQLVTSLHK